MVGMLTLQTTEENQQRSGPYQAVIGAHLQQLEN